MSAESVGAGASSSTDAGPAVSPSGRTSPALAYLSSNGFPYNILEYEWVDHGGAAASTAALHLHPSHVLKTLIFDDRSTSVPFIVIQHGDASVDVKRLAAAVGGKKGSVALCHVDKANEWSGYLVGGTSPFGLRRPMRVFVERSVTQLKGPAEADSESKVDDESTYIVINGGGRGLLVRMTVETLMKALDEPQLIEVTAAPKKNGAMT